MRRLLRHVALEPRQPYDGSQLRPHFLRQRFGLAGDAGGAGTAVVGDGETAVAGVAGGFGTHTH